MANRVYNFAAGPAAMPLPVLEQAARELTDCGGTGMSVMEMSHRSPAFEEIIASAEAGLRRLMKTTRCCSFRGALPCSFPWCL